MNDSPYHGMLPCHDCGAEMDRRPNDFYDHVCSACKEKKAAAERRSNLVAACILFGVAGAIVLGSIAGYILKALALIKYLLS